MRRQRGADRGRELPGQGGDSESQVQGAPSSPAILLSAPPSTPAPEWSWGPPFGFLFSLNVIPTAPPRPSLVWGSQRGGLRDSEGP